MGSEGLVQVPDDEPVYTQKQMDAVIEKHVRDLAEKDRLIQQREDAIARQRREVELMRRVYDDVIGTIINEVKA